MVIGLGGLSSLCMFGLSIVFGSVLSFGVPPPGLLFVRVFFVVCCPYGLKCSRAFSWTVGFYSGVSGLPCAAWPILYALGSSRSGCLLVPLSALFS